MLTGRYRDVLTDRHGTCLTESGWRPNLVVDGAFQLLAALLKRDPEREGILYWAVGEGSASWDVTRPASAPGTSRLTAELHRIEVSPEAIAYVDEGGAPTTDRSPYLEVGSTFEWPEEDVTLREFGLFGGDASERPNSGTMINHVIHPRTDVEREHRLTRHLRLSLGRTVERRWIDVAEHWLGRSQANVVDGIGPETAEDLTTAGLTSVGALAGSDPAGAVGDISFVRLLELRAKARLMLRTASEIHPPAGLHELTVSEMLVRPPSQVAEETGVPLVEVIRLREQLGTLELTLDHAYVAPLTVRMIAGSGS